MGKATEKGLEEVANTVLKEHFKLEEKTDESTVNNDKDEIKEDNELTVDYPTASSQSMWSSEAVISKEFPPFGNY